MTLPPTMRAVQITRYGGPEVLALGAVPTPVPGDGEVLVAVRAASVNRPDVSYRIGIYDPPPGASRLPGLDVAGIVVAVGPGVSRWRAGDAVCALTNGGGYAEFCAVPQGQCLPLPDGLDFVQAAALPEAFFTAWVNVLMPDLGRLAAGETFLVQGGTSGVGIAAIQLARGLRDATVVATAGTAAKRALCASLGARASLDYRDPAWPEQARAAAPEGFDLVLDGQGAPYLAKHLGLLRAGGRLVLVGTHDGTVAEVDLRDLMRRRLALTGSTLRPRSAQFKATVARDLEREIWPRIARGEIRMPIGATFPLAEAAGAHRCLEAGAVIGKVVLVISTGTDR